MKQKLPNNIEENNARITEFVLPFTQESTNQSVFLVDADRTLSPDDTSRIFLRLAGLDPMVIKRRFQEEGYCFSSFRFHAQVHIEIDEDHFDALALQVAQNVNLHTDALAFLRSATEVGRVYIVSAGIPRIWEKILHIHNIPNVPVIGGIDPRLPFVFGRDEKGVVANLFKETASLVVGVGDSDVDSKMLQKSDHAVMVVNHRKNEDLLPNIIQHNSLWQVAPQSVFHQDIPILSFPEIPKLTRRISCP